MCLYYEYDRNNDNYGNKQTKEPQSRCFKKREIIERSAPLLATEINKVPRLHVYAESTIQSLGQVQLEVDNNNVHHSLYVLVSGLGPDILRYNWLSVLKMNWSVVRQVDR